jgi:peptidoglycan/LPS O-acetylase OafA/YrhL
MRAQHLPTNVLDSIRGLAALYVVVYHARLFLMLGETSGALQGIQASTTHLLGVVSLITKHGHAAVLVFFLISGYAIHYRQANLIASGKQHVTDWKHYAWNRARRLYPPLLMALSLTFLLDTVGQHVNPSFYSGSVPAEVQVVLPQPTSWESLIGTLLFVQGIGTPLFGTDGALWSLAYEGCFYAAYPLVLLLNRRLGPLPCLAAFAMVGVGAALLMVGGLNAGILPVLALWPAWVAGVFIADMRAGRIRISRGWWRAAALTPLAFAAIALLHYLSGPSVAIVGILTDWIWVVAIFGPLALLVAATHPARRRNWLNRLLQPLHGLGAMSYSLYVIHMPVLALFSAVWLAGRAGLPSTPWLALAGIAVAAVAARFVYMIAERPLIRHRTDATVRPEFAASPVRDLLNQASTAD